MEKKTLFGCWIPHGEVHQEFYVIIKYRRDIYLLKEGPMMNAIYKIQGGDNVQEKDKIGDQNITSCAK
jgi:hypothetical protein